jgi:hypothetical protein
MESVSTTMSFLPMVIEVIEEDAVAPADNAGDPTISLHALTGIQPRTGHTMQIIVNVDGARHVALLNSGSTHNFIDEQVAARVSINFEATGHLRVAVANGDRLSSSSYCHAMHIVVHREHFYIDYYGLTLGSYDMVLGVQWLESLGPILWDFHHGTLAFIHEGRRVRWMATTSSPTLAPPAMLLSAEGELVDVLLQEFAGLF